MLFILNSKRNVGECGYITRRSAVSSITFLRKWGLPFYFPLYKVSVQFLGNKRPIFGVPVSKFWGVKNFIGCHVEKSRLDFSHTSKEIIVAKVTGLHAELIVSSLQSCFDNLGYAFFVNGDYNLNILGIRSSSGSAKTFDDCIVVAHKEDSRWCVYTYPATTEPGTSILQRPIVSGGTAILVPNQYRGVYQIDTHGGKRKYTALCQRLGEVEIWRDDNRDSSPDCVGPLHEGFYGINIHRHWGPDEREYTGGVSAGCQVFQVSSDFYEFMDLCNKSADAYGNAFTYTLIHQDDIQ